MKIVKSQFPTPSLAEKYLPCSFWDVYRYDCQQDLQITPDDLQVAFWTQSPGWIQKLFVMRNAIVKFFGLKTDKKSSEQIEDCIRNGKNCGFMSVTDKSEQETVLRLTDKHLDAYLSVLFSDKDGLKSISLITIVHIHNLLGYLYFYTIMPFHKIVVKNMLKSTIKRFLSK